MAFVERRGQWFRIIFRHQGRRYTHTLKTTDPAVAEGLKGGIEKTLMLLDQKVLKIPEGMPALDFVLANGQAEEKSAVSAGEGNGQAREPITLQELKDRYIETHSMGAMEKNSLDTVGMHLGHFIRTFGVNFPLQALTLGKLQEHVNRRAKKKGIRNRPLSSTTMRKEMASMRACWNWGVQADLVTGNFPSRGLKYPITDDKPPFQTWQEIERQIGRGGLSTAEQRDLWDCLYLTLPEIEEMLIFVQGQAKHGFLYPMFCFAAHTGARRSEMMRARISDLDLENQSAVIREKKRARGRRTSRRVPISDFLAGVLRDWLAAHPGGPFLFCHELHVARSKTKRTECSALTKNEANDHFKRTVYGSKWDKLRGWHVFRHSFASNCAAKGVDQRLIDEWMGHQTEEMRRRYRHLYPGQQRQAIQLVFGGGNPVEHGGSARRN